MIKNSYSCLFHFVVTFKPFDRILFTVDEKIRHNCFSKFNPIPPRLFSNLFPLGGGCHVSHPVELDTKFFLHQNFSLSGLRVSIADFGFEGPGFDSQ